MDRVTYDSDPWRINDHALTYESSPEFKAWIDEVFERVRGEIGGYPDQRADRRYYGEGEFGFAADAETGDAFLGVDHPRTAAKKGWLFSVEWRAYQPKRVADRLVECYRVLARTSSPQSGE